MGHFTLMRNFWSHKVSHFIWKCQNFGGNIGCVALPDTNSEKKFYTNSAKKFLLKIV